MLSLPEMIVGPAEQAGLKVPPDVNAFDKNEYPHWNVFCAVQLGSPMPSPVAHWENAELIAKIPEDQIREVTFNQLLELGLQIGLPIPQPLS